MFNFLKEKLKSFFKKAEEKAEKKEKPMHITMIVPEENFKEINKSRSS